MSQQTVYHIPDFHFDYYCIITNKSQPEVLMICEKNGWSLPYFISYEHNEGVVGHINRKMKAQLGLDVTTLCCFYDSEVNDKNYKPESKSVCRVYAMENHSDYCMLPLNARWVKLDELSSLTLVNSKLRPILESWLTELNGEEIKKEREPWAKFGWFEQVAGWINLQLTNSELIVITDVEQVKSWEISCIIKVITNAGNFYFKAGNPVLGNEAAKTQKLAKIFPKNMPQILAIEPENQWMLMHDFTGNYLEENSDICKWEEAMRLFAEMQIQAVKQVDILLAFGFPDRRLDWLISQIDLLLADKAALVLQQNRGLSETELETLRYASPQLVAMCHEFAACDIPPTLIHGDFHCQNLVVTAEKYIYFDWSDAAIGHPFFDAVYFLHQKQLPNVKDVQLRLRNAYLEPWTVYLSMKELTQIFEKARPLTLLYRAIMDYQIISNLEDEAKHKWGQVVPYWLKKLLDWIDISDEVQNHREKLL